VHLHTQLDSLILIIRLEDLLSDGEPSSPVYLGVTRLLLLPLPSLFPRVTWSHHLHRTVNFATGSLASFIGGASAVEFL
jgi:hypothetical protein